MSFISDKELHPRKAEKIQTQLKNDFILLLGVLDSKGEPQMHNYGVREYCWAGISRSTITVYMHT